MAEKTSAQLHREHIAVRLSETSQTSPQPNGIEIVAITAGNGNGWQFSAEVLRESLALWDGAEWFRRPRLAAAFGARPGGHLFAA